jgi:hypothetical protein
MLRDIRDLIDDHEAYAEELRHRWGGAVRVLLHDEGNGDRPITSATYVFASHR